MDRQLLPKDLIDDNIQLKDRTRAFLMKKVKRKKDAIRIPADSPVVTNIYYTPIHDFGSLVLGGSITAGSAITNTGSVTVSSVGALTSNS